MRLQDLPLLGRFAAYWPRHLPGNVSRRATQEEAVAARSRFVLINTPNEMRVPKTPQNIPFGYRPLTSAEAKEILRTNPGLPPRDRCAEFKGFVADFAERPLFFSFWLAIAPFGLASQYLTDASYRWRALRAPEWKMPKDGEGAGERSFSYGESEITLARCSDGVEVAIRAATRAAMPQYFEAASLGITVIGPFLLQSPRQRAEWDWENGTFAFKHVIRSESLSERGTLVTIGDRDRGKPLDLAIRR